VTNAAATFFFSVEKEFGNKKFTELLHNLLPYKKVKLV